MKAHNERYEIFFKQVQHHGGVTVDVVADTSEKIELLGKSMGLMFMSDDKGSNGKGVELGHEIWGVIKFKDVDCLKQAQHGLELLQDAISRDAEYN